MLATGRVDVLKINGEELAALTGTREVTGEAIRARRRGALCEGERERERKREGEGERERGRETADVCEGLDSMHSKAGGGYGLPAQQAGCYSSFIV